MNDDHKPAIAITMGDPCGIGPEVVAKALADPRVYSTCRPVVVGNSYAMEQAVGLTGVALKINEPTDLSQAGLDPGVIDLVDIGNLNAEVVQNLSLIPGTYFLRDSGANRFNFSLTEDGLFDYDPASEAFVDGAGTAQLTVQGFDVIIDPRTSTAAGSTASSRTA